MVVVFWPKLSRIEQFSSLFRDVVPERLTQTPRRLPCTTLCPTRSASQPRNCSNYTTTPGSAWLGNLLHTPPPWKWNKQNTGECGTEQLLNKDEETDIRRKSTPLCEGGSENINFVKWIQILLYCHQLYDWPVIQLHHKLLRFGRINGISMDKLMSE